MASDLKYPSRFAQPLRIHYRLGRARAQEPCEALVVPNAPHSLEQSLRGVRYHEASQGDDVCEDGETRALVGASSIQATRRTNARDFDPLAFAHSSACWPRCPARPVRNARPRTASRIGGTYARARLQPRRPRAYAPTKPLQGTRSLAVLAFLWELVGSPDWPCSFAVRAATMAILNFRPVEREYQGVAIGIAIRQFLISSMSRIGP